MITTRVSSSMLLRGATCCLLALQAGCSGNYEEDEVVTAAEAIENGDSLNPAARPYEELMVDIRAAGAKCSGTLLGNNGLARYVLTARHCVDGSVTADDVVVGRNVYGQEVLSDGVSAIYFHPESLVPMPNTVDVALVKMKQSVPVSARVYFTNETPSQLIGTTARCYGAATFWAYRVGWAEFEIEATDSLGNPAIHYGLASPNYAGQAIVGGDSGGACVRNTGTTSAVIYGITKTSTRQTAAVAFSNWVRNYVPR